MRLAAFSSSRTLPGQSYSRKTRMVSTLAMTDHHERLGGQLGGPFQDPLNEARISRGGVGEGSEREREAQDDEPPSRGNQCRTTSEHDSPTKKTPSREFHRPLPGRSVLELGAPISLGWRTEYRKDG